MNRPFTCFGSSLLAVGAVVLFPSLAHGLNPNHDCNFCHVTHSASGPTLMVAADVEVLCLTCHGPAGTSTLKADVHTNKAGSVHDAFRMTCTDCHDPHSGMDNWLGGINLKLIGTNADGSRIARINTPNSGIRDVVFESLGSGLGQPTLYSFADSDEDNNTTYDGICEVCHTQTNHHRNDEPSCHYTGGTCTDCHGHDQGFLLEGASSCSACHANPQGPRRAVFPEFSLTSHHALTVSDADCAACHETCQHQQGMVVLKDADGGASTTLTGDPFTDAATATAMTPVCLSCHDADAANGLVPFSDGMTPPDIASVWSGSSHDAAGVGCFGGPLGCHATGHGSSFPSLLLSRYETADYTTYNEGDGKYQACWDCHNENQTVAQNNKFEDLHRKHVRGEDAPCIMCHDTHGANDPGEPGLINFEFAIQNGYDIQYINGRDASTSFWTSGNKGFCYIRCHGKNHTPKDYKRDSMGGGH